MDQAQQVLFGLPFVIFGLLLLALTALLPLFVAMIASRLKRILQATKDLEETVKTNTRLLESHGSEICNQLQANNALTRQLLRAYGHEPEA
jgi:hypothetical protein